MSVLFVLAEHDYKVGETVTGKDAEGRPFSGKVSSTGGRFNIFVDGIFTPCSLIDGWKARRVPAHKIGEVEFPKPAVLSGGIFD